MPSIDEIILRSSKYLPGINVERVRKAYDFAEKAHCGQKRFSGEPYIMHPLSVAEILLDFHPDEDSIVSALLHDVAEDTPRTLDEIEREFGPTVRNLCWGLQKLSKVRSKLNDSQADNLRKLFLAMAKDFRVVLIKLCDRLHNMRTFSAVRPEKQKRIAQETMNIYAPIAGRLGIYRLKGLLEDLCFKYLNPLDFSAIESHLEETGEWRTKYIETAEQLLNEILLREGIHAKIDGRVKSIYSIYRKLQKKGKSDPNELFDVFAMRIMLPDIFKHGSEYTGHVYTALGVLHNSFTPLANRFKDYIAVPKVNGYRSLHTTVIGLGPKTYTQPTEVQIRTESMHQAAEFGIAAHWLYEETDYGAPGMSRAVAETAREQMDSHREWISGLEKLQQEAKSNQELLENLQVDVFQDRIFVLTPRGDVKDLPARATPVDFAYAVHSDIGNTMIGARVNGSIVPLDYELKSGEVVDVITRKNASPSHQWLSFVKTNHARNRIRGWVRTLDEEKHIKMGRDLLNEKLVQLGKPPLDDTYLILRVYDGKQLNKQDREAVLRDIGTGALLASAVVKKIFTLEELIAMRPAAGLGIAAKKTRAEAESEQAAKAAKPKIFIGGAENVPHQFVSCCNAGYGDDLIGYVTRGRGVSLHKQNCKVAQGGERSRLTAVRIVGESPKYPVRIKVEALDRVGLVRDISQIIFENSLNIIDLAQEPNDRDLARLYFVLEVMNIDQLERVLSKLEKIPSVRRAFKVN